jgi:hypothetical protein
MVLDSVVSKPGSMDKIGDMSLGLKVDLKLNFFLFPEFSYGQTVIFNRCTSRFLFYLKVYQLVE